MRKATVKLKQGNLLDQQFKNLINELIELSGYDSIIDRKDNSKLWNEVVVGNAEYHIVSQFTEDEIDLMNRLSYAEVSIV